MKFDIDKILLNTGFGSTPRRLSMTTIIQAGAIVLVLQLSFSSSVNAQDKIGIFFDENASANVFNTTELNQEVSAYVTVLLPSHTEGLEIFECRVDVFGSAGGSVEPYGGCANGWAPFPNLVVFCDVPLLGTDYVVFAEYIVIAESPTSYIEFYIRGPGGIGGFGPYYRPVGSLEEVTLLPESGDFTLPLATINGSVPNDVRAWGGIKALYR